jgi:hypothetical protein
MGRKEASTEEPFPFNLSVRLATLGIPAHAMESSTCRDTRAVAEEVRSAVTAIWCVSHCGGRGGEVTPLTALVTSEEAEAQGGRDLSKAPHGQAASLTGSPAHMTAL